MICTPFFLFVVGVWNTFFKIPIVFFFVALYSEGNNGNKPMGFLGRWKRSQVTDSGSSNLPVPRREMVCMRLVDGHGEEPLDTPPKIHMELENWWFVNVSPFLQGSIFRFHVSFWGRSLFDLLHVAKKMWQWSWCLIKHHYSFRGTFVLPTGFWHT